MTITRFKLLGLAAIPMFAVLALVVAFAIAQSGSTSTVSADVADPADCATDGSENCMELDGPNNASVGSSFKLTINAYTNIPTTSSGCADGNGDTLADDPANCTGISGIAAETLIPTGLTYASKGCANEAVVSPAPGNCLATGQEAVAEGVAVQHGFSSALLPPRPPFTSIAPAISMPNVTCAEKGTFTIVLTVLSTERPLGSIMSSAPAGVDDVPVSAPETATVGGVTVAAADTLKVVCKNPTETPTRTETSTPTDTPTPTNTPASPPIFKSPDIQNLWLTRQGTKIPSATCESGNDVAVFQVGTDTAVTGVDPKNPPKIQDVGAFEFEVHFDDQKVCVDIEPGLDANKMSCFIDGVEGVARIGCVTLGKPVIADGVWSFDLTNASPAILGDTNCILVVANNTAIGAIPALKGNQVATGASDPACTGGTDSFGWIASPAIPPGTFGYDNSTNELNAIIPCSLAFGVDPKAEVCEVDGSVVGTYSENAFTGEGVIGLGDPNDANPPVPVSFDIDGVRIGRIPVDDLATVTVRPQPDVYSQAIPNQDNGVVVQLNNQKCELADLQGHAINVFSCDDADVTMRFLEGDVEPDCEVDTLDTQGIAFRWGAEKGSLFYLERFNLEPSGTQSDDDIDIKDLQFVYGRFGSTCDAPHPTQDPVNPKA